MIFLGPVIRVIGGGAPQAVCINLQNLMIGGERKIVWVCFESSYFLPRWEFLGLTIPIFNLPSSTVGEVYVSE